MGVRWRGLRAFGGSGQDMGVSRKCFKQNMFFIRQAKREKVSVGPRPGEYRAGYETNIFREIITERALERRAWSCQYGGA